MVTRESKLAELDRLCPGASSGRVCGALDEAGRRCELDVDHLRRKPAGFHRAGERGWRDVEPVYLPGRYAPVAHRINGRVLVGWGKVGEGDQ